MFECDPVKERNKKNKIAIQRKKKRQKELQKSTKVVIYYSKFVEEKANSKE